MSSPTELARVRKPGKEVATLRQSRIRTGAATAAVANAIAMRWSPALSTSPPRHRSALDHHTAVAGGPGPDPERGQAGGAHRQPIALLHPQLPGPGDAGGTAGGRGGDEHRRELVDRRRHQRRGRRRHRAAPCRAPADPQPAPPPEVRRFDCEMSAPICSRMASIPVRVGFTPTPRTSRSEPGRPAAAARRNAAEEMSPGTSISVAARCPPPSMRTRDPSPAGRPSLVRVAPNAASILSVWSRVGTASVTQVRPFAYSPARRMLDFTWALATGVV